MACAIRLALPALAATPLPVHAQSAMHEFDVAGGPLGAALAQLAAQAGQTLSVERALTDGKSAAALRGRYTLREALDRLLAGSGLEALAQGGTVQVHAAPETALAEVRVRAAALPAFGESPPEPGGLKAEFQDSATKTPLPIRETPQAISVITRDSMDARQVRDTATALELAAGVFSAGSGHGGPGAGRGLGQGENFNLRGQDLQETRDVRVDGFATASSAFDLAAYERIEAVKGPSSMLYGQGSLGGFVNLVRRKPQAERGANAAVTLGSFYTRRVEADLTGPLDRDKRLLGRLTAAFDDQDSFTDGVETRTAMVAPSLETLIGERTRALLQVLYQEDRYVPSQGVPMRIEGSRARAPDIPRSRFIGIPSGEESRAENALASLRLDHQITDRWLATLQLQGGDQNSRRFFDSYGYSFTGLAGGDVTLASDTAHIENRNWAGELRLDGKFSALGREHRVLVGLEQNQRKNHTRFGYQTLGTANIYTGDFGAVGTVPGGAANLAFDVDESTKSKNHAAYGQLMLSVAERTRLIAGVRLDSADQSYVSNRAGGAIVDEKRDSERTLRFAVTQGIGANATAYASYAESFNPVSDLTRTGKILDAETGKGYEVGMKTEWLQKRLGASVAVFQQDLDNRPITDPVNPDFSISGGLQRTKGIEVELAGSPYRGLTVGVAAALLDNKIIDPDDESFGLKPYGSYDRQLTLHAGYEIQGGALQGFGFGATFVYVGRQSLSFGGAGDFYGTGSDEILVDAWRRIDLHLHYHGFRRWQLSLHVRNLTDEFYIERVRDASGSNYFGSPLSVLLRARYDFNLR